MNLDVGAASLALTSLAREDSGRVLAVLARKFGNLDLAEEAVQDALVKASETWPIVGIPTNPAGWLMTVARNGAIDRVRRDGAAHRRVMAAAPDLIRDEAEQPDEGVPMIVEESEIADDQLRLLLLCCHPALDQDAQVALTLRLVGGLTTPEIAAAYLVPEATLAQRLVRAKRKIRDAGIPLTIPAEIGDRVAALLQVLYLIFNEAYLARGATDGVVRVDLADQSIRLTRLLRDLLQVNAEAEGLLALELFHRARLDSRADSQGELILLDDQDRTRWDLAMITEANGILDAAMQRMQPGPFQMQALIASHHANARTAADTDWSTIARLYDQFAAMTRSPIAALNAAVAVAMADGPNAGLARLAAVDGLDGYYLFHSTKAELLLRANQGNKAAASFETAMAMTTNPAEQRHLARRLATCK